MTETKEAIVNRSPRIELQLNDTLCYNDTVIAKASVVNMPASEIKSWLWSPHNNNITDSNKIVSSFLSSYYVSVLGTSIHDCPSNQISKLVAVRYGKEAKYTVSQNKICVGDTIMFTDISTPQNPNNPIVERTWNIGNSNIFSPKPTGYQQIIKGSYTAGGTSIVELTTKNQTGCISKTTVNPVEIFNSPFSNKSIRYDSIILYGDKSLQLQARNAGSTAKYLWKPQVGLNNYNIINPLFNYSQSQDYLIDIFYNDYCKVTDTLKIWAIKQFNIHVPGGFSPNGDNNNDVLKPILVGISKLNYFRVFNQQNKLLYETTITGNGWDGTYKGTPQAVGSYIWLVEGIDINGNIIRRKGSAILIR